MSVLLCTAGYDHTIRFWAAPTGHCLEEVKFADSQVNKLQISPDRKYLLASGNPHVRLFDIVSKRPVRSFEGHKGNVTGIGFQRTCSWVFTASEDGSLKIWDLRAPGVQRNYQAGAGINCAQLHPNQAEILTGDEDGRVQIWDLAADKLIQTVEGDKKVPIRDISVAVDASLFVACNSRGSCFVWESSSTSPSSNSSEWTPLIRFPAHKTYCLKSVLSPDLKYLATASSDQTVRLWDIEKGFSLSKTLEGHQRWVWDCTFSADSAYLLSCSSDKTARLWEMESGNPVVEYRGHSKAVTCLALNDSATGVE